MTGVMYWLDLAGVMAFALSGVVVALCSRMDPFKSGATRVGSEPTFDRLAAVLSWVVAPTRPETRVASRPCFPS